MQVGRSTAVVTWAPLVVSVRIVALNTMIRRGLVGNSRNNHNRANHKEFPALTPLVRG